MPVITITYREEGLEPTSKIDADLHRWSCRILLQMELPPANVDYHPGDQASVSVIADGEGVDMAAARDAAYAHLAAWGDTLSSLIVKVGSVA